MKIKKKQVECVAADGQPRSFPLTHLVWAEELENSYRVCHLVKDEIAGTQIKKLGKEVMPGFVQVTLPNGSRMIVNKRRHRLYKD